jgi:hypothetical protein
MDRDLRRRRVQETAMKINFERWAAIAFVGCMAIAAAILPADGGKPVVTWFATPERTRVSNWQTRLYARANHGTSLLNAYDATRDLELARETFGTSPARVGEPEVRFASDVSGPMRAKFMQALGEERAQRPEWKGNGKVGIIVRIDTAVRINGQTLARLGTRRNTHTETRTIAPGAATGDRCVVIVELPNGTAWGPTVRGVPFGTPRPLLDACGFYDAFGMPGAQIANDLATTRFFFARGYGWLEAPRDTAKHGHFYTYQQWYFDASDIRCLAYDDQACVEHLRGTGSSRSDWYPSIALPTGTSTERLVFQDLPSPSALNRLVLEVGPQRFSRIWQSPKSLDQAYLDETGRTLGQFVRNNAAHEYGIYHPGPWTSSLTAALTLITIAALFVLSLRFGARPKVA